MNPHQESEVQAEKIRERLEKEVHSLKQLLSIKRRNISECSQELIDYCLSNVQNDALITKIPASKNPFRETTTFPFKSCKLL